MGKRIVAPRSRGAPERPEALPARQWVSQVEAALVARLKDGPDADTLRDALARILQICLDFKGQVGQQRVRSPQRIDTRLKQLERCKKVLASLLESNGSTTPTPSSELRHAMFRATARSASTDLDIVAAFTASEKSYVRMAQAIVLTLGLLGVLVTSLRETGQKWAAPPPDSRRLFVRRLMEVFCEVRGDGLAKVTIGDPEFKYNPLISFLMAVTTPISGLGVEFPIWISGGALRPIAEGIRKAARS